MIANEWTPFHTGFELFLIVLGKSDENMPYWLGLGDSFAMLYMAVTYCLGSGFILQNVKGNIFQNLHK